MERSRSLLGDKHSRPISRHRSCRRHRRSTFRWVRLSVGPASISASTAVVPTAEAAGRTQSPLFPPTGTFAFGGYLIGGTVGGNYQIGSFVIGLEGDGDWSHLSGTTFQHFMCRPWLPNEERSARHGAGPCRLDLGPGDVLRHRGRCFR